jgi:type II secretory pathway pseudopilin PulG
MGSVEQNNQVVCRRNGNISTPICSGNIRAQTLQVVFISQVKEKNELTVLNAWPAKCTSLHLELSNFGLRVPGRPKGVSVKQSQLHTQCKQRRQSGERGITMVEIVVVIALIMIISAIAIFAYLPTLQDANFDTAMRQMIDQLRQAREYSIANRRYVQVTFPTVVVGGVTEYQVVMTEMDSLTTGGGAVNPVLSTVPIHAPAQYLVLSTIDTPDGFCLGVPNSAIEFKTTSGGAPVSILFQSDGELVDGASYQPVNGTIFLGEPGKPTSARAITILGTTGRVRGWKGTGASWSQF